MLYDSFQGFVFYFTLKNEELQLNDYTGSYTQSCFRGQCSSNDWDISVIIDGTANILSSVENHSKDSNKNVCTGCKNSCSGQFCLDCNCKYKSCVLNANGVSCHCNWTSEIATSTDCACSNNLYYDGFTCQSQPPGTGSCMYSVSNVCYLCTESFLITKKNKCSCSGSCFNALTCTYCDISCSECSPTECIICKSLNASPSLQNSKECSCDQGFFNVTFIDKPNDCIACHASCKTCSDGSSCLTCKTDNQILNDVSKLCECKVGFYSNTADANADYCLPCHHSCESCLNENSCSTCEAYSQQFDENSKLCSCKAGFYINPLENQSNYCLPCHSSCRTCSSNSSCLTCIQNSVFNETSNFCRCEDGLYLNETTRSCINCHSNCLTCENSKKCKVCRYEFSLPQEDNQCICGRNSKLISKKCVCDSGFYRNETETCFECPKYCKTCIFNSSIQCTGCEDSTILVSGFCYCSNGDMWNGVKCLECEETCSACESEKKCLKCASGLYLNQNFKCVSNCGSDFEGKDGICIFKCGPKCKTCGKSQCDQCIENAEIYGKSDCKCRLGYVGSSECTRATFSAQVKVIDFSTFSVFFDELLKTELVSNDFLLKNSSHYLEFAFKSGGNNYYELSISINSTLNEFLLLEIVPDVESTSNSILYPKKYNITIFSYDTNKTSSVPAELTQISTTTTQAANATSKVAKAALTSSAAAAVASNPSSFWTFFNIMEFISYLPMNGIPYPKELREFIRSLGSSSMITIPYPDSLDLKSGPEPYKEAKQYGIDSSSFLANSAIFHLTFFAFLLIYPLLYIRKVVKHKTVQNFLEKKQSEYKFNFFIRFWLQSFLTLALMAAVQIRSWIDYSSVEGSWFVTFNFCFAVFICGLALVSPFVLFILVKKNQLAIENNEEKFSKRFGSLTEEFKNNLGLISMLFYFLFVLKRILFIGSQVFLNDFLYLQGALNIFSSSLIIFYMIIYLPFKEKITMFSVLFGEFCTLLIMTVSMFFINNHDEGSVDLLSKIITFTILAMISIQALISVVSLFQSFKSLLQRLRKSEKIEALSTSSANPQAECTYYNDGAKLEPKSLSITNLDS